MFFRGKICWVTGAGSGIGAAISKQLVNEGATVILSGRKMDKLLAVQQTIDPSAKNTFVQVLDLSEAKNFNALTEKIISQTGEIDYLINNAGISQRAKAIETDETVLRRLMEVNFFGTVALTQSVLKSMIPQRKGCIICISSLAGKFGYPMRAGYCASKHALQGYFETLRTEIAAYNIKVLMVSPGLINTEISKNALLADGKTYNKMDEGQAKGMTAAKCVAKIISAIKRDKKDIVIGNKELLLYYIKRFCQPLFFWLVKRLPNK